MKSLPADARYKVSRVKEMSELAGFCDQNGDVAYAMFSQSLMQSYLHYLPKKAPPLLSYLIMGDYFMEPWLNPQITNCHLVGAFLWTGRGLMELHGKYATLHGLPKDVSLLSSACRRTVDIMAHSGCMHFMLMYRWAKLGKVLLNFWWDEAALRNCNIKSLEGAHGFGRTDRNSVDFTLNGWNRVIGKLARRSTFHMKWQNRGFNFGGPKNTLRENQGKILSLRLPKGGMMSPELEAIVGLAGELQDSDFRMGVGCAVPETYGELLDLTITGIERGLANALYIYEKLNPRATGELKIVGLLPGVGAGHWGAAMLSDDFMQTVVTGDNAVGPGVGPGGTKHHSVSEKTATKLRELNLGVEAELGAEAGGSGATDCSAGIVAFAITPLLKDKIELEQSLESAKRLDSKIQARTVGGVDVRAVARGDLLLGHDGAVHPDSFLDVIQLRERVHRECKFNFIVGLLPEFKVLPNGHSVSTGTLLLVAPFKDKPKLCALVRVQRVYVGSKQERSFQLSQKNCQQKFLVELCTQFDDHRAPSGDMMVKSIGRELPMMAVKDVMWIAEARAVGFDSCGAFMTARDMHLRPLRTGCSLATANDFTDAMFNEVEEQSLKDIHAGSTPEGYCAHAVVLVGGVSPRVSHAASCSLAHNASAL